MSSQVDTSINGGDTSWLLAASILVMFMTPGLAFFYGGLVRQHNLLTTIGYSLITFSIMTILWYLVGFSLVFGPTANGVGFLGTLHYGGLKNINFGPDGHYAPTVPFILFFFFQLKFAAITPALITGAISTRVKFGSFMIFIIFWHVFAYCPVAHWLWNQNGWLANLGAIDFAGGIVVHITAGFSALAAALIAGKRTDNKEYKPCNIPFVLLGTAILWFGWFGFNGGSSFAANSIAVEACVVTTFAASAGALTWMLLEYVLEHKKISMVGFAVGSVVGLATVTPASGYIKPWAGVAIGCSAAPFSYIFVRLKRRFSFADDTLDVFSCHGMGGLWGSFATGFLATKDINPEAPDGAFYGNGSLVWKQIVAICASAGWSFVVSCIILYTLKITIGLRVSEADERLGLDVIVFHEDALNLTDEDVEKAARRVGEAQTTNSNFNSDPHQNQQINPNDKTNSQVQKQLSQQANSQGNQGGHIELTASSSS